MKTFEQFAKQNGYETGTEIEPALRQCYRLYRMGCTVTGETFKREIKLTREHLARQVEELSIKHVTEADADRLHELIEEALRYETGLPFVSVSDAVSVYLAPKVMSVMPEIKFGNIVFDIEAIGENIRARSAELKSRIDARAIAAQARMGERH